MVGCWEPCRVRLGRGPGGVSRVLGVSFHLNVCSGFAELCLLPQTVTSLQRINKTNLLFPTGNSPGCAWGEEGFGFYPDILNRTSFLLHSTL